MKRLVMMGSLFAAIALAGCSKSDDVVGKIQSFKDQMCACKPGDTACADKVDADEDKWEEEAHKGSKPDEATLKKFEEIKDAYRACRDTARGE